jgi:5-methylcytosine-specific restriction endonuclease McrA
MSKRQKRIEAKFPRRSWNKMTSEEKIADYNRRHTPTKEDCIRYLAVKETVRVEKERSEWRLLDLREKQAKERKRERPPRPRRTHPFHPSKKPRRPRIRKPKFNLEYITYLDSPEWREKRTARLIQDGYKCVHCGCTFNLHVHHLTYRRFKDEHLSDLITLCQPCHERVHGRRF